MMSKTITLNLQYRYQLLVGLVLGIWIYLFLVLVGPFDAAELPISIRIILMHGYGLIFFITYALLIPIQNKLHEHFGRWKLGYEIAMVTLFFLICLPIVFAYYKTNIVNGTFPFDYFALSIYLPTIIILVPIVFVGRYLVAPRLIERTENTSLRKTVILLGENKLDILKIPMSDLVALKASSNYVEVYYLLEGKIQKKLLRSTLSRIHKSVPEMTRVHRSYLINSDHFIEWHDSITLVLTQLKVPVSQKHKTILLSESIFAPK